MFKRLQKKEIQRKISAKIKKMEGETHNLVNRFTSQNDSNRYKQIKGEDNLGKETLGTDGNGDSYDQVDMAPYRWRKPARQPVCPLVAKKQVTPVKDLYASDVMTIQAGLRSVNECEQAVESPEKNENDFIEVKQERRNIFANLFRKKPFGNKTNVDSHKGKSKRD